MSDVRVCHCFFFVVDRVIVDYLINIYINIKSLSLIRKMRITEITMMTFELLPSLFPPKTNYDDDSNQIPLPSALLNTYMSTSRWRM